MTLGIRSEGARERNRRGKQTSERYVVELVTAADAWGINASGDV